MYSNEGKIAFLLSLGEWTKEGNISKHTKMALGKPERGLVTMYPLPPLEGESGMTTMATILYFPL